MVKETHTPEIVSHLGEARSYNSSLFIPMVIELSVI